VTLWFYDILSKTKSLGTLNKKGRISMPELYHTPQQLSQYDFPIYFSHKHKYMYKEQSLCKLLSQNVISMSLFKILIEMLFWFILKRNMSKYYNVPRR
jgi:hypothetical protein